MEVSVACEQRGATWGGVNVCLQSVTTIVEEAIRELNWEGDDICTVLDILQD